MTIVIASAEKKTVRLTRPVPDFEGNMVTELTFREPNGKDIKACGYPLTAEGFHEEKMARMIGVLGNLPPPIVDMLPLADWTACASAIASFLDPSVKKSSTDIMTALGSGEKIPAS